MSIQDYNKGTIMLNQRGIEIGESVEFYDKFGQIRETSPVIQGEKAGPYIWVATNSGNIYSNYEMDKDVVSKIKQQIPQWQKEFEYNRGKNIGASLYEHTRQQQEHSNKEKTLEQKQMERCYETGKKPFEINNLHNTRIWRMKTNEEISYEQSIGQYVGPWKSIEAADIRPGMHVLFEGAQQTNVEKGITGFKDLEMSNVQNCSYDRNTGELLIESRSTVFKNTDTFARTHADMNRQNNINNKNNYFQQDYHSFER